MFDQSTDARPVQPPLEFRDIPGFSGYLVGNDGSVWSRRKAIAAKGRRGMESACGLIWKPLRACMRNGYRKVCLYLSNKAKVQVNIGVLVLTAFREPRPEGCEVCHGNGVSTDDRLENLRWDTRKGNFSDRDRHGTTIRGEKSPNTGLTENDVREMRRLRAEGVYYHTLAQRFGVSKSEAFRICKRKVWAHI